MSNGIDKLTPTVFLDRKLIVYLLNEKKTTYADILPSGTDQSGRPTRTEWRRRKERWFVRGIVYRSAV